MSEDPFRTLVRQQGARLYRDLPWRRTRDPYAIWISEVMLQQTQVARVLTRWEAWLDRFPDVGALARASVSDVLAEWQGMGYNRRALALKSAAETVVDEFDGIFPADRRALVSLPGIGSATAQGIRAFAFDLPGVYLETNVRTVMLHHFFPEVPDVPDRELSPLVEATCPAAPGAQDPAPYAAPSDADDTPRAWYYAMLDYGAYLKKTVPNPSRRSRSYTRQSRFEGSRRQKRALIVRLLLAAQATGSPSVSLDEVRCGVDEQELASGRPRVDADEVRSILTDLEKEGFARPAAENDHWQIA